MTADPAARWRAGRDGYGRTPRRLAWDRPMVLSAEAFDRLAALKVEPTPALKALMAHRHGRAGALYCGSGDAPSWTGVRTGVPHG